MSLAELSKGLFNDYEPSGAFSIEFRGKDDKAILGIGAKNSSIESFFARPPRTYSVTEKQRSVLQKTLYGGYIGDNGNEFKNFTVSGDLWFYSLMSEKNPISIHPDQTYHDGLSEFFKLRFMLMRYRDYTMTKGSTLIAPSFSGLGMDKALALKNLVQSKINSQFGALANEIQVVWHNYDLDDHFLVRVESFKYSQDAKDVFTIKYDIEFEAYGVDTAKSGKVQTGTIRNNPEDELTNINSQLLQTGLNTLSTSLGGNA